MFHQILNPTGHDMGRDVVQHARRDGWVLEIPSLAPGSRNGRRAGSDLAVCVGLRSAARRACGLRLPLGFRGTDPDLAWHPSDGVTAKRPRSRNLFVLLV
jgi:hypothetical protein